MNEDRIRFISLMLLLTAYLQVGVPAASQTHRINQDVRPFTDLASRNEVLPFSNLTLEISVPTPNFLALHPISIVMTESNRTNKPVFGYPQFDFGTSPISIFVRKKGSDNKIAIETTRLYTFTKNTNVAIPPGTSVEVRESLTLGLNRYFPEFGEYEIQVVLASADRMQTIESNIVTIEIKGPAGAERRGYDLIKNSAFQDYLFSGVDFPKVKGTLESLTALYPKSAYAQSAAFVLGENYFYGKNHSKALTNLLKLENDENFIFAAKVKKYLTEILKEQLHQKQIQDKEKP